MQKNIYDREVFFDKYSCFPRSVEGLSGAGEWHEFKRMLPSFSGKQVLDLGCGFGWHCIYAAEQGAASVVGVDISEKMLARAKSMTQYANISYIHNSIEDYEYLEEAFDIVLSSLAFHYIESFDDICKRVNRCLVRNGTFVFSVEHPIFTAEGKQDWIYDEKGNPLHWPVDNYFFEGERYSVFLGENVEKYHKTMSTYVNKLIEHGFNITEFCEPKSPEEFLQKNLLMKNELRRPMMLIISATKK